MPRDNAPEKAVQEGEKGKGCLDYDPTILSYYLLPPQKTKTIGTSVLFKVFHIAGVRG